MEHGAENYSRYLDGDDSVLVDIIHEYKDGLTLFINNYVHNIHVAEDLTEDTFFKLVTKKPRYSPKYSFKTWLYTIGRNLAISSLRKSARVSYISEEELATLQADELSIEEAYIQKEEKIRLHQSIMQLPTQYSEVLHLAYFELLSNSEIAHIMKKTNKQVENLLYRAKMALKNRLEKEGFVDERL